MDVTKLEEVLERELDYPITLAQVREEIGDTELDAPDAEDSRTIAEVLGHLEGDTYASPNELFETIQSNLPEEYIGRKYYSDRGEDVDDASDAPENEADQSF